MLAQNQAGSRNSHRFRRHDFVGQGTLENSILVDASLMRKRISADDGFVGLDSYSRAVSKP